MLYLAFRGPPDDSGSLTGDHPFWFGRQLLTTCLDCHCSGCQGLVAGVRGEVGTHKVQEVDLQMLSNLGIKLTSDQGNYRVLVTMVSIMGVKQTAEADPCTPLCNAINCATAVNSHTWSTVWESGGMGHGTAWDTGLDTPHMGQYGTLGCTVYTPHTSHGCSHSE